MTRTIARRLLSVIPVMGVVAVCVFLLLHLAPGDPAAIMAGDNATPQNIAAIRTKLGLDQPLWWQFVTWIGTLLRGDLGRSLFWGDPVFSLVQQRAGPTASLALTTLLVAVTIALGLGVAAAARAGTWMDRSVMAFATLGFSMPVFVVGYALIFVFAIQLRWLPVPEVIPFW
ncbi:MAG: ABC transporter permease, partial [Mycobacterium sp.]|nr:ABC transporter permease [Mycobacterium sp.]